MSHQRTLVIHHTDSIGNPYTTRILTDFPEETTQAFLDHAVTLYQELGMGVVAVVKVEEHHHALALPGAGIQYPLLPGTGPNTGTGTGTHIDWRVSPLYAMFGKVAVKAITAPRLKPLLAFGLVGLLLALNLVMNLRTEWHMARQDAILKAGAYNVGVPVPKPDERELEKGGWVR